jgi:hypothetical protein
MCACVITKNKQALTVRTSPGHDAIQVFFFQHPKRAAWENFRNSLCKFSFVQHSNLVEKVLLSKKSCTEAVSKRMFCTRKM